MKRKIYASIVLAAMLIHVFPFGAFAFSESLRAYPTGLFHRMPVVAVHEGGSGGLPAIAFLESRPHLRAAVVAGAVLGMIASPIEPEPETRTKQ